MALLDSELAQIKYELGFGLLTIGAEPYIGITRLFEQVVQPFLGAGAKTTSTTTIVAATAPTAATLTLASATGFTAGDTVVIDVDERQESTTIRLVSGSTVSVLMSLAHSGTYPVTVQGGESIIRAILTKLRSISGLGEASGGAMDKALAAAGVKQVDEIQFFGGGTMGLGAGKTQTAQIQAIQRYWRNELASAIGTVNLREVRGAAGNTVGVY